jgi:hypothetical protein
MCQQSELGFFVFMFLHLLQQSFFVLKQTTFMFVVMAPFQIPLNIKFQFMFSTITHVGANVELLSVEMFSMNVQIFKVPSSSTTLCFLMFEAQCKSRL